MFNSQSGVAEISLQKTAKTAKTARAADGDLVAKWQSRVSTAPHQFAAPARLDHRRHSRVSYANCIAPILGPRHRVNE
jgi:hypothetical protein